MMMTMRLPLAVDVLVYGSTAKPTLLTILSFDSIVTTSIPTIAAVKQPWMLAETHHFAAEFEDFLERSKNINLFS
ncbi:hypothetical protein V9T40_014380 [Parthenolecanium corni]|uniref:Uncharacterized protein n=1 Tax=Parthenolecanium corni TaxID=536013 RepID=A0AAN9T346_9HEMI